MALRRPTIRHKIERTRNKHSRAVYRNDTIVIRLARGLSKEEERDHIHDLIEQMKERVLAEKRKTLIDPFRSLLNGNQSAEVPLPTGKTYTFTLLPGKRTSIERRNETFTVNISPNVRQSGLHRLLWKILSNAELPRIEQLVSSINEETFRTYLTGVRLQFASSQWGSCSTSGIIMLNSALLFTPELLQKYVIIHELAHRKVRDHSAPYWQWVTWAMPGYENARELLNTFRLPAL